jgi:hypothetical protein
MFMKHMLVQPSPADLAPAIWAKRVPRHINTSLRLTLFHGGSRLEITYRVLPDLNP